MDRTTRGPMFLFLCDGGDEARLLDEVRSLFPGAEEPVARPGRVLMGAARAMGAPLAPGLAFARQCLPDAVALPCDSVNVTARAAVDLLLESFENPAGRPWSLHILRSPAPDAPGPGRAKLICQEIGNAIKKRRRRVLRDKLAPGDIAERHANPDEDLPAPTLVQVYLAEDNQAWFACSADFRRHPWRRCLSPFPGGLWNAPENKLPPSRAYRKLQEAQRQFGLSIRPGQTCVDLGASPGGWTWVALDQGARVTAVDRSPLRADLMRHPNLDFRAGDAFRFEPRSTVDWLLCDVIAFPERSVELLDLWLRSGWCRNFCVTVKFRGERDYGILAGLRDKLAARGADYFLRRLTENKNEVTVCGRAA